MEDGQFREAESEEQKSFPFNFRAPRLQLMQDKRQARIFWQSQGHIIADHKQQMVKTIGKDNRTSLCSSWMAPTDAQRKLQTLLADLRKGTSWLNMNKMTAKAKEKALDEVVREKEEKNDADKGQNGNVEGLKKDEAKKGDN